MEPVMYDVAQPLLKSCRKALNRIGIAMALAFAISQGAALGLAYWLRQIAPASLDNPWVNLGVGLLPIYLLGMPVAVLIMRKMPAAYPLETRRIGFGATAAFVMVIYALFLASQTLTLSAMEGLKQLTNRDYVNALSEVLETPTLATFLMVGILGPILEELLCRGFILRRLLPYGRVFAIVASAAIFSLFHGSLFQMAYAFAVGLALGYITVRTGSLVHAVLMHVWFNTYSTFLNFMLTKNEMVATAASAVAMAAALGGVIVLLVKRKTIAYHLRPAPVEAGRTLLQVIKSPCMWFYALLCIGTGVYFLSYG
ncbi:MAG: CPBP family intramembrane metalloprotease [Oscillospiraceae bacterium]|nr:CPBP family intramembrane metalloprotease [Oscillospiraceae bacterium]